MRKGNFLKGIILKEIWELGKMAEAFNPKI